MVTNSLDSPTFSANNKTMNNKIEGYFLGVVAITNQENKEEEWEAYGYFEPYEPATRLDPASGRYVNPYTMYRCVNKVRTLEPYNQWLKRLNYEDGEPAPINKDVIEEYLVEQIEKCQREKYYQEQNY